jgi:hypothetical protein
MSKRTEEKAKHFASFLSSVASASANVGILAPTIAYMFNISDFKSRVTAIDLFFAYVIVLAFAAIILSFARLLLNEIPHDPQ